jgi:hypothetical protein
MQTTMLFLALIMAGCAPAAATPTPVPTITPTPSPVLLSAVNGGVAFLQGQYDPAIGLLEESPTLGEDNFYLTEDNALAAHTLATVGDSELSASVRATLAKYGHESNGFIEVAWGESVRW